MAFFNKLFKKLAIPVFVLLAFPLHVYSAPTQPASNLEIQAKGLFSQSAILTINGKQRLLKQNSVSPEGVKLISANSRTAVISVNGKQQTLHLTENVSAQYAEASRRNVTIPLNPLGQYLTDGLINGQGVELLVDTGASVVAMSETQANQLGLEYVTRGIRGYVETASHRVNSYQITLDQIDIGGLQAHNVQAVVLEGDLPSTILLGMSYLQHVELYEKQGMLNLLEKR
ncbi:MAG: retroviral-like aspartic protease family protein [Pseudomonadales bacterium]|nr:retroviral-like aspartic protease family protein [Pseudomonadales bacterium]